MTRLADRVALITGAGRGIGRATAVLFAAEGARVVVNDIHADSAHETVELVRAAGGEAISSLANLVDLVSARQAVRDTVNEFGKLDVLVNNAGAIVPREFHRLDDETFDTMINVNVKTAFHATLAAMPYLRDVAAAEIAATGTVAYHRKITFTASAAAIAGAPGQVAYAAAKGAVLSLTRSLARELGEFFINVNAVAPGLVLTGSVVDGEEPAARGWTPSLSREGGPDDVARVHLFLCSTDSDYLSGVTVPVTGGSLGAM